MALVLAPVRGMAVGAIGAVVPVVVPGEGRARGARVALAGRVVMLVRAGAVLVRRELVGVVPGGGARPDPVLRREEAPASRTGGALAAAARAPAVRARRVRVDHPDRRWVVTAARRAAALGDERMGRIVVRALVVTSAPAPIGRARSEGVPSGPGPTSSAPSGGAVPDGRSRSVVPAMVAVGSRLRR